jgi:hypothetical protein
LVEVVEEMVVLVRLEEVVAGAVERVEQVLRRQLAMWLVVYLLGVLLIFLLGEVVGVLGQ